MNTGGHRRHVGVLLVMLSASLWSTPRAVVAQSTAGPCSDAAHRALDFWIGHWIVLDTASNTPIAQSQVETLLGGCALKETYSQTVGPGGGELPRLELHRVQHRGSHLAAVLCR